MVDEIGTRMWQIWIDWERERKKPKEVYQKKFLEKLKEIKRPSQFIKKIEYDILNALNGGYGGERSMWQIENKSGRAYKSINDNLLSLKERGWIEVRWKNRKKYIKMTEKGYEILKEWKQVYF